MNNQEFIEINKKGWNDLVKYCPSTLILILKN